MRWVDFVLVSWISSDRNAYDDYVKNFQLSIPMNQFHQYRVTRRLLPTKNVLVGGQHRFQEFLFSNPDGKIRRDFQTGKPLNEENPT